MARNKSAVQKMKQPSGDAAPLAVPAAYLDAWESVDSDEGVPLAVAKRAFGEDPKEIIEELNEVLVA